MGPPGKEPWDSSRQPSPTAPGKEEKAARPAMAASGGHGGSQLCVVPRSATLLPADSKRMAHVRPCPNTRDVRGLPQCSQPPARLGL